MDLLRFSWRRCPDGYEARKDDRGLAVIAPRSSKLETVEPLGRHLVFRQFAAIERTEDAYVKFADTFGLLTHSSDPEPVATFHVERDNLALAVSYWSKGLAGDLERLVNSLDFSALKIRIRDGMPVFEPDNLRNAMWAQLAISVRQGERHKACVWCGRFFAFGPGTERRETAEYCSPKCQNAHAYQRRKELATSKPAPKRRQKGNR